MESFSTVNVLGVHVSCVEWPGIAACLEAWLSRPGRHMILYANAHCLNLAYQSPDYRRVLNGADIVYADGISVVWASSWLGGCRLQKMTGADWIHPFAAWAASERPGRGRGARVYILGGSPGVAAEAAGRLVSQYPGLRIAGVRDGFFTESETPALLEEMNACQPDIVFVGLGSPLQEQWLAAHRAEIEAPVCWAVGALFDYLAGVERRVPAWMYRLGLEWFWRLLVNPKKKWQRYILGNPLFIVRVLRQKFGLPFAEIRK